MTDLPQLSGDSAAIDTLLAEGAVDITEVNVADAPDLLTGIVPTGYKFEALDVSIYDHLRDAPRRVRGLAVVTNTASWLGYYGKHGNDRSEVFGDVQRGAVTAVLNAPVDASAPAWGDHRLTLQLRPSAAWLAWTKLAGQMLSQTAFAEHIEDRTPDFVDPDAASMLEIAQSISATTNVKFESSTRLNDGQRRLQYMEQIESKAGQRGQLDVPSEFRVKVQVWRGVAIAVELTARLRIRITQQGLGLAYVLDRVEDVLDAAWDALLSELSDEIPVPILAGSAPDYAG